MNTQATTVVGFLARRSPGTSGIERWALCFPDGPASNYFAADEDRAAVVATLARNGLTALDDNTVVRRW